MKYKFKTSKKNNMKIINEYIVMDKHGNMFKVIELENGSLLNYIDDYGRYEEISSEYFNECIEKIKNNI